MALMSQSNRRNSPLADDTLSLLARAQAGDPRALEILLRRYLPRVTRWAHGRLPGWARDLSETDDLVQDTLVKTIRNLDGFIVSESEGFHNYLRLAVRNAVRDQIRRAHRRPDVVELDSAMPSDDPSPFDRTVGRARLARYEAALERLTTSEREAVIARLEFGFTHVELAAALGKATPDAARKLCLKATTRLLEFMRESSGPGSDE
jgi:RNA polymerase sigma-70 factor, ECF subfamily